VAERVVAFRSQGDAGAMAKGTPPLVSLHDVWRLALIVGVAAVVLSWIRRGKLETLEGEGKSPLSRQT
jgi:hypothetical protein